MTETGHTRQAFRFLSRAVSFGGGAGGEKVQPPKDIVSSGAFIFGGGRVTEDLRLIKPGKNSAAAPSFGDLVW